MVIQSDEPLPPLAQTVSGTAWVLAVADPGERGVVIFVARPLSKPFTSTEIARVEAFIALYKQIVARSDRGLTSTASGAILEG